MSYTTGKEPEKKSIEVQERKFRIVKNFIRCTTCVRNVDQEKMMRGYYVKNYCNYFKEKLKSCYDPDYDIEVDREKAQKCPYYLPESMTVAADLTYIDPYPIEGGTFEIEASHADGLNDLFASKKKQQ